MNAIQDPLTGEFFYPLRKNQKFESAANRIEFNNRKAAANREEEKLLLGPLLNNREILLELLKPGETKTVSKDYLVGKGYSLEHFTHVDLYENQQVFCLFEFMIVKTDHPLTIIRTK
jgi:hypothetical protein